jgi:ribonuclease E
MNVKKKEARPRRTRKKVPAGAAAMAAARVQIKTAIGAVTTGNGTSVVASPIVKMATIRNRTQGVKTATSARRKLWQKEAGNQKAETVEAVATEQAPVDTAPAEKTTTIQAPEVVTAITSSVEADASQVTSTPAAETVAAEPIAEPVVEAAVEHIREEKPAPAEVTPVVTAVAEAEPPKQEEAEPRTDGITGDGRAINDPRVQAKPVESVEVETTHGAIFSDKAAPPVAASGAVAPRAANDPRGPKSDDNLEEKAS